MVSTHLKNISQIGNLPQIGMKMKKNVKPPPRWGWQLKCFLLSRSASQAHPGWIPSCPKNPSDVKDCLSTANDIEEKPTQNLIYPFCFRHLQNKSRPRSLLSLRKSGSSERDWLLLATVLNRLVNTKMLTSSFPLPKKECAFKKTNKKSQYFQKTFKKYFAKSLNSDIFRVTILWIL